MIRAIWFLTAVALSACVAQAEQYWITYEGDAFPETQGWTRVNHSSPAKRWIEDGKLFIDSREPAGIYDYYVMTFAGKIDPEPGEVFVMRWRLKVDYVSYADDPGVVIVSDDLYAAAFHFGMNYVRAAYWSPIYVPFEPGVFHDYEFRSGDMRNYEFLIDGKLAIESRLRDVFGPTRVSFGDGTSDRSLAQWDYVRFGVIPESGTFGLALMSLLARRRQGPI